MYNAFPKGQPHLRYADASLYVEGNVAPPCFTETEADNWAMYRLRERVEHLINRLKQNRRLATRYEKCTANYRAMWLLAATLLWL